MSSGGIVNPNFWPRIYERSSVLCVASYRGRTKMLTEMCKNESLFYYVVSK